MSMDNARVTTRSGAAVLLLGGLLAVSGCSGSSGGSEGAGSSGGSPTSYSVPPPSSTAPSATATGTSASAPAGSASGTAAGAPGVPEPARQHTEAGARAFVEYYVARLNAAALKPVLDPVKEISTPSCKTCGQWTEALNRLVTNNEHYGRDVFKRPGAIKVLSVDKVEKHLFFDLIQTDSPILSSSGAVARAGSPSTTKIVFLIDWTPDGWRTREVQTNED
ncbi:hypothetical protein HJ588_04265 [Flexivirga sp. ID2601S]|uniref:DUF6318 domain-containing protein n=1 Tax=Flexivirga aerilata TaxID=1656889 RepID=A0A849ADF6_9MICO|nr:DUF6318 family protein [Flexivirga aerilata]NNG38489.1 hypothetical protein [Flexivirga aerilata]